MKMIDHNHFICHLILGTFTEYPIYISFFILLSLIFRISGNFFYSYSLWRDILPDKLRSIFSGRKRNSHFRNADAR